MDGLSAAFSLLGNSVNAAANIAGVASAAKIGAEKQKELMELQNKYSIEAFERSNARQDELMRTSPSMIREGLRAAGYSAADPEGTGYSGTQAAMQQDTPSAPSATIPSVPSFDLMGSYAQLINSQNVASATRLNDIEAKYRAQVLEGKIGRLNLDIEQAREKFPLYMQTLQADLDAKVASKQLSDEQRNKIMQETENLKAVLDGLRLDNRFNEKTLESRSKKISAEVAGLLKDNRIKEAEARLADAGILLGQDGLTMLLSSLLTGQGDEVLGKIVDGFNEVLGALPNAVGSLLSGVVDNVKSAPGKLLKKLGLK